MNEHGNNQEPSAAQIEAADAEPSEEEFFRVMRRRWRTILFCVIVAVAAAYIYLIRSEPRYTSVARLYVQSEGPRVVSEFEGVDIVLGGSENFLYTQAELLQSTPLLAAAIHKQGMGDLRILEGASDPAAVIGSGLSVEVGVKDDIINVAFESPYPEESARVVEAVVEAYTDYQARQRRASAAEVLQLLQEEKVKYDQAMKEKMQAMIDFKRETGVISFLDDDLNFIHRRLATLSAELTRVQLASIEARTYYRAVDRLVNGANVPVAIADDFAAYRGTEGGNFEATLQEAQARLMSLKRDFTDEHPFVQAAAEEVRFLQQQILTAAEERVNLAKQREEEILLLLAQQQKAAEQLGVQTATYAMLDSEILRTEKLCEILDTRIKELDVTQGAGALNVTSLEPPRPSKRPSSPQKGRVLAIGLLLGVISGLGAALAHDKLDQRLQSADEIAAASHLPVLGVVPAMSGKQTAAERGQQIHIEPGSPVAEAFRAIRTAVRFGTPDREAAVLLVTSPSLCEGKSTVASNLAIALAQDKQHTLIIDADFRKPVQHDVFRVDAVDGLTSVLVGQAPLEEVIHPTTLSRLDVLPCGQVPPNPCEMLSSRIMAETIDLLRERYDRIVIDSPAAVPVADARVLATISDAAVLVVKVARSTRTQVRQAINYLQDMDTRLLGVVINNGPVKRTPKTYDYAPCTMWNIGGWSVSETFGAPADTADESDAAPVEVEESE